MYKLGCPCSLCDPEFAFEWYGLGSGFWDKVWKEIQDSLQILKMYSWDILNFTSFIAVSYTNTIFFISCHRKHFNKEPNEEQGNYWLLSLWLYHCQCQTLQPIFLWLVWHQTNHKTTCVLRTAFIEISDFLGEIWPLIAFERHRSGLWNWNINYHWSKTNIRESQSSTLC